MESLKTVTNESKLIYKLSSQQDHKTPIIPKTVVFSLYLLSSSSSLSPTLSRENQNYSAEYHLVHEHENSQRRERKKSRKMSGKYKILQRFVLLSEHKPLFLSRSHFYALFYSVKSSKFLIVFCSESCLPDNKDSSLPDINNNINRKCLFLSKS